MGYITISLLSTIVASGLTINARERSLSEGSEYLI